MGETFLMQKIDKELALQNGPSFELKIIRNRVLTILQIILCLELDSFCVWKWSLFAKILLVGAKIFMAKPQT